MMKLILAEKIDVGCQVAEALYNMGEKGNDFQPKWQDIKKTSSKKQYLKNDNYIIVWTNGHLGVDLKPSQLNDKYSLKFHYNKDFDYTIPNLLQDMKRAVKPDKKKLFNNINTIIKENNISTYYICTDADAEGERIARDLLFEFCKLPKSSNVKRMWITGAFNNVKQIQDQLENGLPYNDKKYENLSKSQIARSKADYLQGMIVTKTLVDAYQEKLYSGRVKNTIIGLIGNRELEIKNFKPKPYYSLNGILDNLTLNHFYYKEVDDIDAKGNQITKKEKTTLYFNKESLQKTINDIEQVNLEGNITKSQKTISSSKQRPLPLSGDDFKSEMFKTYKTSLVDSDRILQYLRDEGFTTYQGTNGRFFAKDDKEIVQTAYNTALSVFKNEIKNMQPNFTTNAYCFNDKKAVKQNHPPLHLTEKIPTQSDYEKWQKNSIPKLKEGYELIAKRILVHFLDDDEMETTQLEIEVNTHKFETTGIKPIKQGWRSFIGNEKKDTSFKLNYKVRDSIKLEKYEVSEKMSTKPKLYNAIDILNILMNVSRVLNTQIDEEIDPKRKLALKKAKVILKNVEGIGTDRTRQIILEETYKELVKKGKNLTLTENGWTFYKALPRELKSIIFTAKWEEDFEKIRRGEETYEDFITNVQSDISKTVKYILENVDLSKQKTPSVKTETELKCPLCQAPIIETDNIYKCSKNIYKNNKQSGCKFSILRNVKLLKVKLGQKHLERLLNGEVLTAPNKNQIQLDLENKYFTKIIFAEQQETDELVETSKTYRLKDKFCFKEAFGKKLTKKEAEKILSGEEVTLKRKSKKTDKDYEVTVWLKDDNKGGFDSSF